LTTVRRSLAYSIADSYLSVAMQLTSTVIVARLLTPAETGIFAVAAVFAVFASTFRDFGVAEYMIQERELTNGKISSALSVNIAVSWSMGLILYLARGPIGEFYRDAGVSTVMGILALNFVLIPFGAVTMAYFRRQMDFRPIFIVGLFGNLTNLVVATACALSGLGYMSLAWASLMSTVVTVATSLFFRPANFPRWPGLTEIASVVRFGKYASGIYIFGQAGKSAPEIIIGRTLDMPSVAFFSRANGLIEIFNKTILKAVFPVCMPYFAKHNREQGSIVEGYLKVISYLTAFGWPFLVLLGILAFGAVRLVYGPQWVASVPLAQILCAAALFEIVHVLAAEAIIAVGRVDRSNLLQFGLQGARIVGLLAVIPFGLEGAAWGILISSAFGLLLAQWMLYETIQLPVSQVIAACLPSAGITVAAALPVAIWAGIETISEQNYLLMLIGGGLLATVAWLLAVRLLLPPLWREIALIANRIMRK
jgi:O-antigen/teichoic acid export membrane protein